MLFRSREQDARGQGAGESSWLSSITAIILIILLAAFYVFTINNVVVISEQVDSVKSSPYPVSVAAGRVETLLVQSRTLADRPSYARTPDAVASMEQSYSDIDADMNEKIDFIANNHHLDLEAAESLQKGYDNLVALQSEFLELCADTSVSDQEIKTFVDERIDPLINQLLKLDIGILDESSNSVESMYDTVTSRGVQMIVLASALMAAVLVALAVYLFLLRRKREQQRYLQKSLESALELAQSANAAKSQFLSNMSHDIRTPMNSIVGLTSIANAHAEEPEHVRECLGRIATSSKHLLCLINDVLDMGKIESGKIILNEERFSFPDMVSGIVTIIQPQAYAKHLELDIVIGNIDRETVIGDVMRLNQALLNLVSNAVKYTPEGGSVRLCISEEASLREGYRNYRFVVQDTGVGMTEDFLDRIFDPFEREYTGETSGIEGTGLGMAITKNVIDMMGGSINVESELGKGSTFTVVLPLKPDNDEDTALDVEELRGMRVLVVDDDVDVLGNTLVVLEELGLQGSAASTGTKAVRLVSDACDEGEEFRAVIVDWIMPGMDGIETVRRIRARTGGTLPIILLTAYDWTEIEDKAKEAGVTAFVSKPLFKSRLCHVLKTLCSEDVAPRTMACEKLKPVRGRVLLVEDNELNREIAAELIRQMGPEVEGACDGGEAVARVLEAPDGHFDLIFMDMKMPRMDGIEATQVICAAAHRDGRTHPPIIAMTANAFNEDRDQALAAGMDGFMTKPIDLKELERILRTHLT